MDINKKYEVLGGIMYGLSNEKISEMSRLSLPKVKQYIYILCQSHGVRSRNELASKMYRKLVSEEQIETLLSELKKGDPLNG